MQAGRQAGRHTDRQTNSLSIIHTIYEPSAKKINQNMWKLIDI
jgi:hypothetical protein